VANEAGESVGGIAFSGTRVVYSDDKNVAVLDTTTKKRIDTIEIGSYIFDLTVCEDGRTLLVACNDMTGRVVDLQTKKSVILKGHTDSVYCIIECGERDVLTCSRDKTICRWNRFTGELIRTYSGHSDAVNCILFSIKTNVMFSGSDDKEIFLWHVETGEKIGEMNGHSGWVNSLAFVNATTIVSGSRDKTVKIWDIPTRKEVKTMSSHKSTVSFVAVTPDGQYVVSGSFDRTVKLWRVATGKCITTLPHHFTKVYYVAISSDGRFIASGGDDCMFRLLSVTPPFSCILYEGPLTPSAAYHRLLSDGRLLRSDVAVCSITPTTSCIVDTETGFIVKNHQSSSDNSNSCVSLTTPSASSAQQWVDAICAVRHNLTLHPDKRPCTSQQILSRYRFDLLQTISITNRRAFNRVFIPKDVMQVIGNYLVRL
jgi:WD40 repeat protein